MQDIDKLKMILLNEEQRKLFEYIPKPNVFVATSNKKFAFDNFFKYTGKAKYREATQNFSQSIRIAEEGNDPLSKKILESLTPIEKEINNFSLFTLILNKLISYYHFFNRNGQS